MFKKFVKIILILGLFAVVFSLFNRLPEGKLEQFYQQYLAPYFSFLPCKKPILYSIGTFDSKFDMSQKDFLALILEAEKVWEDGMDKEFFTFNPNNNSKDLKINLIYDYRQQATDKINDLGLQVSDTRASYDSLRAKYQVMLKNYENAKTAYKLQSTAFQNRQREYSKEVDYWNSRGGAPKDVYEKLKSEEVSIQTELNALRKIEANLAVMVDNINSLVVVINSLAKTLNLNAEVLNDIGQSRGEEFTEGEYKSDGGREEINIYEFSTKAKLVRVLAHELGHALGLEHVNDPNAIMYRLNQSKNGKLTEEDIAALNARCQIK